MNIVKQIKDISFKAKRKLFIKLFDKNLYDGSIHLYITLRCNFNCTYCVNNYDKVDFCGYSYELKSIDEWAYKINDLKRKTIITGGEPFLYRYDKKDIIDLVNKVDRDIDVKIYTNCGIDIIKQLKKLERPIDLMISFHPQETKFETFFNNIDYLKNNRINFTTHIVDALDNLNHPNVEIMKHEMSKRNLSISCDKDQSFEGSQRKFKLNAKCSKKIILLAPDGTRYHCVGKLMRRKDPLENVFAEDLKNELSIINCNEYGYCAPCDWLGETKIYVKDKFLKIPSIKDHIQQTYKIK